MHRTSWVMQRYRVSLTSRAAIVPTALLLWSLAMLAQQALLIDLRHVRSSEVESDASGDIVAKRYKTPLGMVTVSVTENRGTIAGATAKLGANVIARARVLRMSNDGVEIEESQFNVRDPQKVAYQGRIKFNKFRDRIAGSTSTSGTKLYEVFIDWQWSIPTFR